VAVCYNSMALWVIVTEVSPVSGSGERAHEHCIISTLTSIALFDLN
jgi:hypothetical protein